jgi:hypothetical protein
VDVSGNRYIHKKAVDPSTRNKGSDRREGWTRQLDIPYLSTADTKAVETSWPSVRYISTNTEMNSQTRQGQTARGTSNSYNQASAKACMGCRGYGSNSV